MLILLSTFLCVYLQSWKRLSINHTNYTFVNCTNVTSSGPEFEKTPSNPKFDTTQCSNAFNWQYFTFKSHVSANFLTKLAKSHHHQNMYIIIDVLFSTLIQQPIVKETNFWARSVFIFKLLYYCFLTLRRNLECWL